MDTRRFRFLLRSVAGLTPRQRSTLAAALNASGSNFLHVFREAGERPSCPHCHAGAVVRWGQAWGLPRFRCRACRRTFSPLTNTALSGLRHRERWADFALALAAGEPVRQAAERCAMHLNTAYRWRLRFLSAPSRMEPPVLTGIAEADETFFLRSAKGQPVERRRLNRLPRKHGGTAEKRGRSKEQVCVLVARDQSGRTFTKLCNRFDGETAAAEMAACLADGVILCLDGHSVYQTVAAALEIRHEQLVAKRKERVRGPYHIQNVNAFHSRLKKWFQRFNGVSTRHLPTYLAGFVLVEQVREADPRETLLRAAAA